MESYELLEADLEVLRVALMALDRADQATKELKEAGTLTVTDRYGGVRQHPLVDIENKSRAQFARLIAQLRIDVPTAPRRSGPRGQQ